MLFAPTPYIHFRECSLTEGKEWYISFYALHPDTGKLRRCRIKINRINPLKERRRVAREMMASINQRLALGWNPFPEKTAPKGGTTLFDAFSAFLKVKKKEMEDASYRMYNSFFNTFKAWGKKNGIGESTLVTTFNKSLAIKMMSEVELKYTAKTYNNYLGFFKGLFSWLQGKGYISENPFDGMNKKSKRLTAKHRRLLSDEEIERLMSFLRAENPQYLAICLLCYCCFIRPKELAMLRCGDIDLERQVITIDASIAKNDHLSYRTIPDEILDDLRALDLSDPSLFLFGGHRCNLFHPAKEMVCSREIARYWDQVVRPACGFGMDLQFYSLKDTGITNALESGIPINLVQQQADHSSVAMTAIYVGKRKEATDTLRKAAIIPKKGEIRTS